MTIGQLGWEKINLTQDSETFGGYVVLLSTIEPSQNNCPLYINCYRCVTALENLCSKIWQ